MHWGYHSLALSHRCIIHHVHHMYIIVAYSHRKPIYTGDPLHSRALAHSRAPLLTQACSHCSHSRAPGEQWARLCIFTLHGCVQAARLCRGSSVIYIILQPIHFIWNDNYHCHQIESTRLNLRINHNDNILSYQNCIATSFQMTPWPINFTYS